MYPNKKYIIVFQPHTYSRTLKLKKDFVKNLKLFNEIYIYDTFVSREKYNKKLENKVNKIFKCFKRFNEEEFVNKVKNEEKNIYFFVGAGTLNEYLDNELTKRFFR